MTVNSFFLLLREISQLRVNVSNLIPNKGDFKMNQVTLGNVPKYLGESQVSEITGRALQTLRNDRFNGMGIPYVKFGRSVRYSLADVVQFMESRKIIPETKNEGTF